MEKIDMRKRGYYAYMLTCSDGTFYTGYTTDLQKRIKSHNAGHGAKYTRGRLPVKIVWYRKYKSLRGALLEEIRIKRLTRLQKEEMVRN